MATIKFEEAVLEVQNKTTKQELVNLLEKIDISSHNTNAGAKTVLYSGIGDLPDEYKNSRIIRSIDKTDAAEFILSDEFIDALDRVFGDRKSPEAIDFLYNPHDGKGGAWDIVSRRFVEATQGEVITLIGKNAGKDRIFNQVEWEAIKSNSIITSVNDVPRDNFINKVSTLNEFERIEQFKIDYIKHETVAKHLNIKPSLLTQNDVETFLSKTDGTNTTAINDIQSQIKDLDLKIKGTGNFKF